MNATLKQVRAYIAVAQTGSFAEASELIHLSQPALSLAIKKLEECVGGKLFFMTDHVDYFDWSCAMISDSMHWNFMEEEWPHHERSYFQNILPTNQFFCALRS